MASSARTYQLSEALSGAIDLVVTDMVLPGLSGRELAGRLARRRSGLRVLYMTGYTDDEIFRRGLFDKPVNVLEKPFTGAELVEATREELQASSR